MVFPILPSVNDWRKKSKQHPDRAVEDYLRAIYGAQTIYERFDGLIELLQYCDEHDADHENYSKLRTTVLEVIGHIIDTRDEAAIREKIAARVAIRDFDKFFMPWARPIPGDVSNDPLALYDHVKEEPAERIEVHFKRFYARLKASKNLLPYGGKDAGNDMMIYGLRSKVDTAQHGIEALEEFRVIPNNTNLLKLQTLDKGDNQRLTFSYATTEHLSIKAYDSFMQSKQDFSMTGIYTVHINGGMFMGRSVAPERTSFFSDDKAILHPSYADHYTRIDLFMAGQIKVIDGKIIMVDGASGHFLPDYEQTSLAISFFEKLGIVNNLTEFPYYRPTKGSDERDYTPMKCIWLAAMLLDYCLLNKGVDSRDTDYLKEHAPMLYTIIQLQSNINDELARWLDQSAVFFNRPSPHTLKLNNAVEIFSRFGKYNQPEFTLSLLADVEACINEWNASHSREKTTSRRQSAVDLLEIRVMEQTLYYKFYLLLSDPSYTQGDPTPYTTIIDNFLQRKIDLKMFIEQVKPLLGRPGPQFFSGKNTGFGDIEDIVRVITKIEKTNTAAELKEINRQLDGVVATSLSLDSSLSAGSGS